MSKLLEEARAEILRLKEQLERARDKTALVEQIEALSKDCEFRLETICQLREAVANYIKSEGCSCCRSSNHADHEEQLAALLNIEPYSDGSGWDFSKYETKERE